jgi:hypothetical protein
VAVAVSIAGLLPTPREAASVAADLRAAGVPDGAVRAIAGDGPAAYRATPESGAEVPLGVVGGSGLGGLVGTAAGWLAEAGVLAVEVEAAVAVFHAGLAGGPLVGAVAGLGPVAVALGGIGAAAGGLLGLHAGWWGVEQAARTYRRRVQAGDVLVRVDAPTAGAARLAAEALRRHGAGALRGCPRRPWRGGARPAGGADALRRAS